MEERKDFEKQRFVKIIDWLYERISVPLEAIEVCLNRSLQFFLILLRFLKTLSKFWTPS